MNWTRASGVGPAAISRGWAAHVASAVPTRGVSPLPGAAGAVPGRRAAVPRPGRHARRWHGTAGGHTISMGLTLPRRGSLAGPPQS